MSEIVELSEADKKYLQPYLPSAAPGRSNAEGTVSQPSGELMQPDRSSFSSRPFVTLTYACSLDSMISLAPGVRTTLSGPETKSMTHYLRLYHDSILVGVGTAVADDPALNCRYPGANLQVQPQPVVLDPGMRWEVLSAKATHLGREGTGKLPWLIHAVQEMNPSRYSMQDCDRLFVDKDGLFPTTPSNQMTLDGKGRKIEWIGILKALRQKGIESVMIEGGATIINELLSQPDLVDTVVITIAPTWLGQGGITVSPAPGVERGGRTNAAYLVNASWRQFGHDVVVCGNLRSWRSF